MGVVTGLAAVNKYIEQTNSKGEDRPKAEWLKLKDGESVKITFLQEFDKDSPGYNEKAGQIILASEHTHPNDYKKKALCTIDEEGACVGCEQNRAHPRTGWGQRGRLYANVLVDDGTKDPYVAILSQGTSGKTITPTLAMMAGDSGSVTNMQFRIKRSGSNMNNTEYTLVPIMGSSGVDVTKYTLYDLDQAATRHIPYADQTAFYGIEESDDDDDTPEDFSW